MQTKLPDFQIYPISVEKVYYLETLIKKIKTSVGYCPICGNITIFYNFTDNLRESGICKFCKSTNRQRQIAFTLIEALKENTKINFYSIKHFVDKSCNSANLQNLRIYNTETSGSLHKYLQNFHGYISSEYLGQEYKSGQIVNGFMHQDLMSTSWDSSSIDILLSSDVFEHIPDPYKAFAEVHRILKPGGRHIFTVPFYQHSFQDEVRAIIDDNNQIKHLLPPIYHGDPIRPEGILVYVIFSLEMLLKLNNIGYVARMYNTNNPIRGILGDNAIVFDAIKTIA